MGKFKIIYLIVIVSVITFAFKKNIINDQIEVDVVYHFLYDSTEYNSKLLESDISAFKLMHDATNLDFKGNIKLCLDPVNGIQVHQFPLSLYALYTDYIYANGLYVDDILKSWLVPGKINVFALRTVAVDGRQLNGFTPTLTDPSTYIANQPNFSSVFINYSTMFDYNAGAVLSHELGHMFGLNHPWELNQYELTNMGLNNPDIICTNIMNYNCYVIEFTEKQLKYMKYFLKKYRYYLIK